MLYKSGKEEPQRVNWRIPSCQCKEKITNVLNCGMLFEIDFAASFSTL